MSRRVFRRHRAPESTEETVWISFSDLMTALLTVFMLAAVALVFSLTQEVARSRNENIGAMAICTNRCFIVESGFLQISE